MRVKFPQLETDGQVFISSDIHYSHTNICRGVSRWSDLSVTRDFKSLQEMNDLIVSNFNKQVKSCDTLILLGDIAFGGISQAEEFLDRLKCKNIHLILGNHDDKILKHEAVVDRFLSISELAERQILYANFVLCHYPLSSWNGMNKNVIHLHGHVHLDKHKKQYGRRLDVGIDGNDYHPYLLTDIIKMMQNTKHISEIDGDHHSR